MSLIEAQGLTCRFGDFTAADQVTFTVEPGEVVGLLGANGAGKTTTIRMLLGLLAATSGRALLNGGPPSRATRAKLGYVPQGLGLYPELTVEENLAFSAQAYGCAPAALPAPLVPSRDRLVGAIPLGLRRQLAFLCAVQHRPTALVLDEPTSGVEPLARARLWDQIREQAGTGVGVLVTTHYMSEARQCDRLLLMSDGRVAARGTERDIVGDTRAVEVETNDWTHTFEVLTAAGFAVTLAGRKVRVVNPDVQELREILAGEQVAAEVREVPATIEERMTVTG
jgi:ABC-2 type transport system ATP-binding protein/ribosome-dependent ATPase